MDSGARLEDELLLASHAARAGNVIVLVEGNSDRSAVAALARRRGFHLENRGVTLIAMAGASNISHFLECTNSARDRVGLCDAAEAPLLARALDAAHETDHISALELHGFFVCNRDLEDEMIRAVGPGAVLDLIEFENEGQAFERFRNQPAQRGRPLESLLHRFLGTQAGRKIRFSEVMAESVDLDRMPRPLQDLLDRL